MVFHSYETVQAEQIAILQAVYWHLARAAKAVETARSGKGEEGYPSGDGYYFTMSSGDMFRRQQQANLRRDAIADLLERLGGDLPSLEDADGTPIEYPPLPHDHPLRSAVLL